VTAFVDGVAASIASVIAASADRLVMHRTSTLMIHEAHAAAGGNAHDLRSLADTLDMYSGIIAETYGKSGKPVNDLRELLKSRPG
jgi:ATP-dependent protease ClpP protease subunit